MSNSAQRLHDALVSLRKYNASGDSVENIWAEAFETGEISRSEFLRQLADFLELPSIVRSELETATVELPHDLLLEWFPKLQTALAQLRPANVVHGFSGRITDEMLLGLRFCATLLEKHSPEKLLSAETLSDLLAKALQLRSEIGEATLDAAVKTIITERLDDVISAIIAFRITGAAGIERAFEKILGSLVRQNAAWEKAGETTIGKKIFSYVKNLGIVLAFAWTAIQLTDRITPYLADAPAHTTQPEKNPSPTDEPSDKRQRLHTRQRSIEL